MEEPTKVGKPFDTGKAVMALLLLLCCGLFYVTCGESLRGLPVPLFVFLRMASIVGILGILAFFIGESVPRSFYNPDRFPYKCYPWEKGGQIYEKLGVKWRKSHGIDMSKLLKGVFPKQNTMSRDPAHLKRLVLEMCNAELVHWILTLFSPVFVWLIEGWYGVAIAIGYAVSNLGDVMIQRYNRPRIQIILKRLEKCASC